MARPTTSTLTPTTSTLAISAVGIAYAFGTFFARRLTDAGPSSTTVAFARFALVALVLAPRLRLDPDGRRATLWGLGSGAVMALGWIAYVDAIGNGDVALVGVAYMTYPLFTLGALALFFRQKPTGRQMVGGLLVLVAAGVALSADATGGGLPPVTFLASATFGFSLAVLTERLGSLAPSERLASAAVGAVAVLLPVISVLPADEVVPASAAQWGWILGLGVGAALAPMLLFAAAAPVIGAARSSVAGATELSTVPIIGALVFGEVLTARHLVAAVLVGGAIVVTSVGRAVHVIADDDDPEMPLERPDLAAIPGEIAGEG